MLLNDKVQFRMQWPQYADLQINGMPCIDSLLKSYEALTSLSIDFSN